MTLRYIKIEPLSDEHDCETCGTSWATGYEVTFPDGCAFALQPHASCFGGKDWSEAELMEEILKHLGYTVVDPNTSEGVGDPDERSSLCEIRSEYEYNPEYYTS
jgi:hypothetical protein